MAGLGFVAILSAQAFASGGVNLGNLPNYHMVFTNGSVDANWQGASKGFIGNVAVNGLSADLRTSGTVPFAGTIFTNASNLGAWQDIVDDNAGQASAQYNQVSRLSGLESDLSNAFAQVNAMAASAGFSSKSTSSLNGLNTQNGLDETFVINVTSEFQVSDKINITGDSGDKFIMRWDTDSDSTNGYQGQVKFQSGGAIVPLGGLTATSFVHVAGDINASGGGNNPSSPFPQGPRTNNGQGSLINGGKDFSGGGFFTGYWLTTGTPTNQQTSSLSNAVFVGGWYTSTSKFSMTSGTSGVYFEPVPEPGTMAFLGLGVLALLRKRRK
ncbi:MAG: PEP-CTERM sorting domain-containing protein [Fimbriimonadaceae bacterium]|nr:PEP-CTERM sorting domain-containing protein [Fimbriimonadaceae bacterium]